LFFSPEFNNQILESMIMQKLSLIIGLGMLLAVSGLQAESGGMDNKTLANEQEMGNAAVMISAPADGAVLAAYKPVKISYKIIPGPKGDHAHLYIDKFRAGMLHQRAGDHEIKMLHPGLHKIRIEIVTEDHQHIGVGKEITVDAR
jgi:hypothetical protein